MRTTLHGLAYRTVVPALRMSARTQIAVDRRRAGPADRRLLTVLARALADDFSREERTWFARVERLRKTLLASAEPIQLIDYGAGSPDSSRTAEEMGSGVVSTSTVGEVCMRASKPPFWARLLFALVREYRPENCVELGTCLGISAAYQTAALALGPKGASFTTMEGAPELAERAQRNLEELGLGAIAQVITGRFDQALPGWLQESSKIDYAFIDGHHDEQATIGYFEALKPQLAPGAVLVFDDIAWSHGMKRAWQTVSVDPVFEVTVDLRSVGIGVLGAGIPRRYRYYLR